MLRNHTPNPTPQLLTIPFLAAGSRCQWAWNTVCHAASPDFSPTFQPLILGIISRELLPNGA